RSPPGRSPCIRARRCSTSSSSTARRAASSRVIFRRAQSSRTSVTWSCSPPAATATFSTSRPTRRRPTATPSCGGTAPRGPFGTPCFTQIHPTCIPQAGEYQSKLTLMSESLRNDGRIWVPKQKGDTRKANDIADSERDYYLERRYPSFGNLVPRDVASRAAKEACDEGHGVGPGGHGVYLDFRSAIERLGLDNIRDKYGNLFEIYERITGDDAYQVPMRIYPAPHY